jgi:hypothetical protein
MKKIKVYIYDIDYVIDKDELEDVEIEEIKSSLPDDLTTIYEYDDNISEKDIINDIEDSIRDFISDET